MKRLLAVLLAIVLAQNISLADEGMWIPMLLKQLNEKDMQAEGLRMSAEDIYSINKSSLKDAVVHFGGGCTAEIVSSEGLMLTNHHCGFGQIQSHSSVDHDYLKDGFWAMDRDQELPNPGLTATFIVRMEDVTAKVLAGIDEDMDDEKRASSIKENIEQIIEAETKHTHYGAHIRAFYYGAEYYMFITETFNDVRLVGAPPSSIGKFGGDTDNWMWPRHTGDFSVFRIYADKHNKPAEYSRENVPYIPKHHIPVSLKGVKKGDFTMVYGFPGSTQEYLSSYAIERVLNNRNPNCIAIRDVSLSILDNSMHRSDELRIKYASKYARISNYHKKWQGENKGLIRFHAIEKKKTEEKTFELAVSKDPTYTSKYGSLMEDFSKTYNEIEPYAHALDYYKEVIYYGPDLIYFTRRFRKMIQELTSFSVDVEMVKNTLESLKKSSANFYRNYDEKTDKKLFVAMLEMYYNNVKPSMHPAEFEIIRKKYKGDFSKYADYVYSKSIFTNQEKLDHVLNNMSVGAGKKLAKDPGYNIMNSIILSYYESIRPEYDKLNLKVEHLNRLYMEGQREILTGKKFYPDANSTLRLSFGKVDGYYPMDGVKYDFYTTLDGIIEKAALGLEDYEIDDKMRTLYQDKDYGQYGYNDEMRVCFTASNHTTGGNSGSPVFDADGYLIGINFDRSWESTMSDINYDARICRNIVVDIRYVLFIMDKFAGAKHLVDEMTLITQDSELKSIVETKTDEIFETPFNPELYNIRAVAYFQLGEEQKAFDDFLKCVELDPKSAQYQYNMGSTLVTFKELKEASEYFSRAIELDPIYLDALYNRGKTFADLGLFERAIADFTEVIKLNPNHSRSYNNRGVAKNLLWGDQEGCEDIRKAMEIGSKRAHKTYENWCDTSK